MKRSLFSSLWMRSLVVIFVFFLFSNVYSQSVTIVKNPDKKSPYFAIIQGLKLIKMGKFDNFISRWCSAEHLCYNDTSIASLKKYNLPAMQRMAPQCLKNDDTEIHVTRIDGNPETDNQLKIFIKCQESGMPKPFRLSKEGRWKFKSL